MLRPFHAFTRAFPLVRLNLFGITGAATRDNGCHPAPARLRLNLFGITGAATRPPWASGGDVYPPQSLWNHGCCDSRWVMIRERSSCRLNLFGITGAATPVRLSNERTNYTASISLESRVLRHARNVSLPPTDVRLNLFGITGAATSGASWEVTETFSRLNLFGITGAATRADRCGNPRRGTASISLESRVLRQGAAASSSCVTTTASISLESRVLRLTLPRPNPK